jgi:transposase, IS30 family
MAMRVVGRGRPLSVVERDVVLRCLREGASAEDAGRVVGCSGRTVQRLFAQAKVKRRRIGQSDLRLSFEEREQISRGLAAGVSLRSIAREVGRSASTVSREVAANGGRRRYRALGAHERAIRCSARPKAGKLTLSLRLRAEVEAGLIVRWSPGQISARLRIDHPDDLEMRISPETIYQALYVQTRGELRRQLTANLRQGRAARKARGGEIGRRGQIKDMICIAERPAEIEDRAVPGHWEGDLLVGARNASFIATLVERHTRFVMLTRLGKDRTTEHVITALQARIAELPEHLKRSLTWDRGKEMAAHQLFTVKTGIDVYFCDPHSPWQRGSNENTNGLLRQYLPKATDLAAHTQADLDAIAAELNGRPRETLGFHTPAEKINELLMR